MSSANNYPSILKALKSPTFAIWVAMLSVLVQSFHSFTVFYGVSELKGNAWGIAQAVLFAVIVDLAILFYTVRGNLRVTWMFAFVMVLINAYYYYTHLGFSFAFVMGVLLSFVLPVSVYFYSEEIGDDPESDSEDSEELISQIETLKGENKRMIDLYAGLKGEHDLYDGQINDLMDRNKDAVDLNIVSQYAISQLKDRVKMLSEQLGISKEVQDQFVGVDLGSGESETVTMADGKLIAVDEANEYPESGILPKAVHTPVDDVHIPPPDKGFANLKSSIPRTDRPSK